MDHPAKGTFADDLGATVAALKGKHGTSDIDASTRLLMCAATLYLKNETEAGRRPSPGDFAAFSRATFMTVMEIMKRHRTVA